MKAIKQTVKKEAEKLLNNSETTAKNSWVNSITKDNFICEFHNSLTNDDLIKRAAAVDRACYHDRKINGAREYVAPKNDFVIYPDNKRVIYAC